MTKEFDLTCSTFFYKTEKIKFKNYLHVFDDSIICKYGSFILWGHVQRVPCR
ncbi:hypothetical protein Hanom_Chr10g00916041 [Helianthus anomalus]